jgi:hypothetical protein
MYVCVGMLTIRDGCWQQLIGADAAPIRHGAARARTRPPTVASSASEGSRRVNRYSRCFLKAVAKSVGSRSGSAASSPAPMRILCCCDRAVCWRANA